MRCHLPRLLAVGIALCTLPVCAADTPSAPDPYALAAKIDQHLDAQLKHQGVTPAPKADDPEFLRRATLDLNGRIPYANEIYKLLNDKSPAKRRELINRLLDSPGYVNHFTNVYRHLFLPEASTNFEVQYFQIGFENWMRGKLKENTPYDKLARDLITAEMSNRRNMYYDPFSGNANPLAFFQAKEAKPENIAAATAKIFLGIQIECAQCHDHPFARWTRDQFWGTAAFFAGIERTQNNFYSPMREIADRREIAVPNSIPEKVVQASFLNDKEPQWKFQTSSRITFAEWMTANDNPYFARTAVNRIWAQLFGIGIVDPVDDFNDENKASHPELLAELTQAFIASKYDVKFLIRAITATEAYQRTSSIPEGGTSNPRLYGHMAVKGMTGEQMFESLSTAIGYRDPFPKNQPGVFFGGNNPRTEFMTKFAASNKPTESQTSILQALTLMNGKFLADATSLDKSETLAAIVDAPFMETSRKIETLYLTVLGRKPRPEELAKLIKHVESGDAAKQKQRLGDVMWTLLNSVEFRVNH